MCVKIRDGFQCVYISTASQSSAGGRALELHILRRGGFGCLCMGKIATLSLTMLIFAHTAAAAADDLAAAADADAGK
jgi:hypothetical protein